MSIFEFISVALSFVIGLGIARLLTAIVALFRARSRVRLHWMPLVWAAMVFLWMIQYWWAIFELSLLIQNWQMWRFAFLLLLALCLFAAAAMSLPIRPGVDAGSLLEDFEHNGRWGLVILIAYFSIAVVANWALFGIALTARMNLITASLTVFPAIVLLTRNTRIQGAATLLNVPLSVYAFLQFSPDMY